MEQLTETILNEFQNSKTLAIKLIDGYFLKTFVEVLTLDP